jgi:hypothetical protein
MNKPQQPQKQPPSKKPPKQQPFRDSPSTPGTSKDRPIIPNHVEPDNPWPKR